ASASALVSGKITILADDTVKGGRKVVQLHSKGCHFYRTFKNSGMDANGHRFWFIDHNGTLCPSKASPTGLVKVSGGKTGRPCMNPAAPMSSPYKVITGTVILVKSFAHFNVPIRASVSVYVQDSCGHAGASVLGSATISLTSFAKAKGNVSIGIFGQTVFNLKESVAANIVCGPTQTITTTTTTSAPPTTTTQTITTTTTTSAPPTCKVQSVEAPEEVYNDGETRPIRAQVTAANGHSITLTFTVPTHYGTFYSPTVGPFTSSGSDQKSATYTAPKDDTSAGKTETVTVSCHDNTTGQDGTPNSASFPIKPVPTVTTGGGSRP
ncbi:MAG TPA: hypothetical protein VG964_01495, partial [Candidatus Saccharimonadales bacterium]|nr:hypothetical protein [Candidatus Saccharimonadales bacterium]